MGCVETPHLPSISWNKTLFRSYFGFSLLVEPIPFIQTHYWSICSEPNKLVRMLPSITITKQLLLCSEGVPQADVLLVGQTTGEASWWLTCSCGSIEQQIRGALHFISLRLVNGHIKMVRGTYLKKPIRHCTRVVECTRGWYREGPRTRTLKLVINIYDLRIIPRACRLGSGGIIICCFGAFHSLWPVTEFCCGVVEQAGGAVEDEALK